MINWPDFLSLKWCGIVLAYSHTTLWSFARLTNMDLPMVTHLTHMGLPLGSNTYLWNRWVNFSIQISMELSCLVVFYIMVICPCGQFWLSHDCPIKPIWACPWARIHISETAYFCDNGIAMNHKTVFKCDIYKLTVSSTKSGVNYFSSVKCKIIFCYNYILFCPVFKIHIKLWGYVNHHLDNMSEVTIDPVLQ